jgi:hypothetical protein
MDEINFEAEMEQIFNAPFAKKTDRQLQAYQQLSDTNRALTNGVQPKSLQKFNNPLYRKCKLTSEQVTAVRKKYLPNEYGIMKLAKEYCVSKAVIRRIVEKKSWKI